MINVKENTFYDYEKSINRVVDYINHHLFDNLDLKILADVANISTFHFHRIFKAIIGENTGEYVNRIRLEYIAELLQMTNLSLNDIADETGYANKSALSRAFKKHFDVSPSIFRTQVRDQSDFFGYKSRKQEQLSPTFTNLDSKTIVYIRIIDTYGSEESYSQAWSKLGEFAKKYNLITPRSEYLGLSFDNPTITPSNRCRYYACFTTEKEVIPEGPFGVRKINAGFYAVFTLKGSYDGLLNMYYNIYMKWLPNSGYKLRRECGFEKYLNNSKHVEEKDILTEIYVPVIQI